VPDKTFKEIRVAINKAWALGGKYFIEQIKNQVNRQSLPKRRGGDRRSRSFVTKTNRVWTSPSLTDTPNRGQ
jgi:hypothetical protein